MWVAYVYRSKHLQAALKRLQKNNIWGLNHQQTPSSLIHYIAYSVMKLTKGFHAHKHA